MRTKSFVLTATSAGYDLKMGKWVPNEDVRLIGFSSGPCQSSAGAIEYRVTKGVSDPTVELEWDDVYFNHSHSTGAATGEGSGGCSTFLPPGHYFEIDEDEPVFVDLFAQAIGDGGSCVLYYVCKRDWKK